MIWRVGWRLGPPAVTSYGESLVASSALSLTLQMQQVAGRTGNCAARAPIAVAATARSGIALAAVFVPARTVRRNARAHAPTSRPTTKTAADAARGAAPTASAS